MAKIQINKDVLRWAREECNLDIAEAAQELKTDVAELISLESGDAHPSLTLLRKMAKKYGLPLATLVMPSPLPRAKRPKDFRTIDGRPSRYTRETAIAIRTARRYTDNMAELYEIEPETRIDFSLGTVSPSANPEALASRERVRFGITYGDQCGWHDGRVAFINWRNAVESLGIFVYLLNFPKNDCKGFSLMDGEFPVIVISKKEPLYQARIFTLLHEYCHILLRQPGLSDLNRMNLIEKFCNQFAAAFLMPQELIDKHFPRLAAGDSEATDDEVRGVASRLKVSQQSLALRLEELQYMPNGYYRDFKDRQDKHPSHTPQTGGAPSPYVRLAEVGGRYASTVMDCLERGSIRDLEAARLLDLKPSGFGKVRETLHARELAYGPRHTLE